MMNNSEELTEDLVELIAESNDLDVAVTTQRVLRQHKDSYVAQEKKRHQAVVSVCYAKSSKRVMLSKEKLKSVLNYDGNIDWLDVRYDDENEAILIGKSDSAKGIKPIIKEKKYIIYSACIVKDFVDTLKLDFNEHSSVSVYEFEMEKIAGKDFIVISGKDFV